MSIEKFLKRKGIVRNRKQANLVMVIIIALCMIYIFSNLFSKKRAAAPEFTPEEIEMMMLEENNFNNQETERQRPDNELYY